MQRDFKVVSKGLKGKLRRDGKFYWVFVNGTTVGRKDLKKKG